MRVGDKRLTPFERTEERDRCVSFSFHDSIRTSLSPRLEIWLNFNFFFVFAFSSFVFNQASFRGVRSRKENGWLNRGFSSRSNELIRKFERTACEEEGTNCGDTKISEAPLGLPPRSRHHRGWTDRIALAPLPFFFFFSSSRFQSSIESWFFRHRVNAFDLSKKRSWDKNYEKIMEATLRWRKNFFLSISISLSFFFFLSTLFVRLPDVL